MWHSIKCLWKVLMQFCPLLIFWLHHKRCGGINILIALAWLLQYTCAVSGSPYTVHLHINTFPPSASLFIVFISIWSHAHKTIVSIVTLNSVFKDFWRADTLLVSWYFLNSLWGFLATSCSISSLNIWRDTSDAFVQVMAFHYVFLSYFFPAVHNYINDFLSKPLFKV